MNRKRLGRIAAVIVLAAVAALAVTVSLAVPFFSPDFLVIFGGCLLGMAVMGLLMSGQTLVESALAGLILFALIGLVFPVAEKQGHPEIGPICLASLVSGFLASRVVRGSWS